jgi:hypothetical protein
VGHEYDALRNLETRLANQEKLQMQCSADVKRLAEVVEANNVSLAEFVELGKALKVGIKLAGYVEAVIVWCTKVAVFLAGCWAAWKFLVKEAVAQLLQR